MMTMNRLARTPSRGGQIGFRPQHRGQTHATFPLVFNALWWNVSGS